MDQPLRSAAAAPPRTGTSEVERLGAAALLDQIAEGVIVADRDGRLVLVNEAAARIHGVRRLDVEPDAYAETYHLLTEAGDPYPPDRLPLTRAVRHGETVVDARWRIRRPDGTEVLAIGTARPLLDADGAQQGAILTLRDDTARHDAERDLAESEARFRAMADSAPAPIWVTGPDGIEFANKAFEDFAGLSAEALRGDAWTRIIHPDDLAAAWQRRIAAWEAKEPYEFTARFRGAAGDWLWMHTSSRPRFDASGTLAGYVGMAVDVTEARRAEAELRESEERYHSLFDSIDAGFCIVEMKFDRNGRAEDYRFVEVNPAFERQTGLKDAQGRWAREMVPGLEQHWFDIYGSVAATGRSVRFDNGSGPMGERWFDVYAFRVGDPAAHRVAILFNEISARKQAEQALRDETRTLETLNRTGAALAGELDLEKIVQMVTDAGVDLIGARFGAFFYNVLDQAGESYMLYTLSGVNRSAFENFPMPRNTEVFGPTFRGEGIVRSDDITADPRYGRNGPYHGMPEGHLPVRSYLAVPVASRSGEVLGGLFFGHEEAGRFTERHERLMAGIAAQASIAVDNARLYSKAQRELEERRAAEEELQAVLDAVPAAIWIARDPEAKEIVGNRRSSELLRIEHGRNQSLSAGEAERPAGFRILHDGRELKPDELPVQRAAAGRAVEHFEEDILFDDGARISLYGNAAPLRDAGGEVRGAVAAFVDVTDLKQVEKALRESEERFRAMADNISQFAWMANADGWISWYNRRWYEYTGTDLEKMQGWGWQAVHHPDHVERVTAKFAACVEAGEPWEDIFPLRSKEGEYRWFLSRAQPIRDRDGRIARWFGTNTDITEERRYQQHLKLLIDELNHRVKNTLAIVQSLAHQTFRNEGVSGEARRAFEGRLEALATAHNLLTRENWESADLRDIVAGALHAHRGGDQRFDYKGPALRLEPKTAVTIAMALHELATNALKYGALSVPEGKVTIRWSVEGERLRIGWQESGGPSVAAPTRRGFGSRMIERALAGDLRGTASLDFRPAGLVCEIDAPLPEGALAGGK